MWIASATHAAGADRVIERRRALPDPVLEPRGFREQRLEALAGADHVEQHVAPERRRSFERKRADARAQPAAAREAVEPPHALRETGRKHLVHRGAQLA